MRACAAARNDARGAGGLVSSRGLQNILFVGSFNRVNEEPARGAERTENPLPHWPRGEVQKMKVGVFWWTSPGAPKKKLTSIFGVKSKKMELFSCK